MKKTTIVLLALIAFATSANAQYPYGDKWYQNPLGFEPLKLHAGEGFLFPAVAAGLLWWLTPKDSTLNDRFSIYNENGYSWGYKYPYTQLYQNSTGFTYQVRRWMSVGSELDFYFPSDAYNSTVGIAIRPFARFYPVNNSKLKVYFESGGGMIYFVENFPKPTFWDSRLGTYWNGTTKYGIGGEIKIDTNTWLMLGIRHVHVSNGNKKGVDRNPSHDSNGFFIGFSRNLKHSRNG